jgi:uncharacterized protein YbaP (TraB family)
MLARLQCLLIAGLIAWHAGAAHGGAPCPPAATPLTADELQQAPRDRGFLWRVTRDGRSSYLYGTLHVAKRAWAAPGPQVRQALRASDVVAVELDMLDPDIRRRLGARLSAARDVRLAPALSARLNALADATCVSSAALAPLRPEVRVVTLTALAGRRDGIDPAYGIDLVLSAIGHGAGKPVLSLETPESQAALLLATDARQIGRLVDRALSDLESGKTRGLVLRLADVWAESRLDELERYAQWCECLDTREARAFHARLLGRRNPELAERLEHLHAAGQTVFGAVGALHMVGNDALTQLLARRGFRVERVVPP